jgi:hypothetical protein
MSVDTAPLMSDPVAHYRRRTAVVEPLAAAVPP